MSDQTQALANIAQDEQVALIRKTVSDPKNPLNQDEFALFLAVCKITGLNPLERQIYALKIQGRLSIHVGIDGLRRTAALSGQYAGQVGPFWCGEDGEWKDIWLSATAPAGCKVGVFGRGDAQPTWGVARYRTFYKQSNSLWNSMPEHMLSIRAEAFALKKRFNREMGMLHLSEDEAPENDTSSSVVQPDQEALPAPRPSEPGTWQHIAEHGQEEAVPESPVAAQNQAPIHESDDVAPEAVSAVKQAPEAPQRASEPSQADMPRPRGRPPGQASALADDHPLVVKASALWKDLQAAQIQPERPARTEAALTAWLLRYESELANVTPPVQEAF